MENEFVAPPSFPDRLCAIEQLLARCTHIEILLLGIQP